MTAYITGKQLLPFGFTWRYRLAGGASRFIYFLDRRWRNISVSVWWWLGSLQSSRGTEVSHISAPQATTGSSRYYSGDTLWFNVGPASHAGPTLNHIGWRALVWWDSTQPRFSVTVVVQQICSVCDKSTENEKKIADILSLADHLLKLAWTQIEKIQDGVPVQTNSVHFAIMIKKMFPVECIYSYLALRYVIHVLKLTEKHDDCCYSQRNHKSHISSWWAKIKPRLFLITWEKYAGHLGFVDEMNFRTPSHPANINCTINGF